MKRSVVAALAWISAGPLPAQADCVSDCAAASYCDSEMNASGACSAALNTCYARECNRTRYGAIAYGAQSGAYGWSNDLDDAQAAEKAAMAHCSAHGDDCQVVVDFWNTCAAVAAYRSIVAYGLGATRARAEEQAVTSCTRDAGAPCEVQAWSCTKP